MALQYSPTQFFLRVPSSLLARHFKERHGVLAEIAFDKRKEADGNPIFEAVTKLSGKRQAEIETEC